MTEHQNPSVWKLLPASDAVDQARADQDARWRQGNPLPAEKYLTLLPRVAADPELAMVLIYGEVLSRTERGESPTLEEYRRRFPRYADHLAVQFQLHSALGKGSDTAVSDPVATDPADQTRLIAGDGGGETLPEQFGPFRVREVIGRGGMGVVLAADDPALDRVVAIKTLRPGRGRRVEAATRFAREARISAKLQHPSVPPVYAVGELPDGTPYLVMKLVGGRTLADRLAERSLPSADLPALLRVFEQVCQAVGFAHSRGIVHRDLKPANVMVGEFGEVQVMDWGLAREMGKAEVSARQESNSDAPHLTQAGTVLGTPAYMAPEQARGEPAGPPADVFSLGAMLCELLTGQPPFVGRSGTDVVKMSAAAELQPARRRLKECGADAELVTLAEWCLAAKAAERPATGAAVAAEIGRYHAAADERVRAAEQAAAAAEVQAVEQRKRRRVQLALVAAVATVLLVGGAAVWVVQKQNGDRELEQTKQLAERTERKVKAGDAVDRGITQALDLRRRALWKAAGDALDQAEAAAGSEPDPAWTTRLTAARDELNLLRDLDTARLDRVFWQGKRGQKADSDKRYAALFADHGFDVINGDPDEVAALIRKSPIKAELLSALDDWVFSGETQDIREKVLEVAKAVAGKSWRELVNKKLPEGEQPPTGRDLLAAIPPADRTPMLYIRLSNKFDPNRGNAVQVLRDGVEQFPNDFWLAVYLAMAHEDYNELGFALASYRTARALRPDSWQILNEMGVVCFKMNERPAAMRFYRQSLATRESAPTFSNLGNVLRQDGKLAEAIGMQKRATDIDPTYANAWTNLGVALRDNGDIDEAEKAFRKAIELDNTDAAPRFNLGLARLTARNDAKGAIAEFEQVIDKNLKLMPEEKSKLYTAWAHALTLLDRWNEAELKIRMALEADDEEAETHFILADILCHRGHPEDAIPEYREAIRLNPKEPNYLVDLGVELRRRGEVAEAIRCYKDALKLNPNHFAAHINLSFAYITQKDYANAVASARNAIDADKDRPEGYFNLAVALAGQGDEKGAELQLKRAKQKAEAAKKSGTAEAGEVATARKSLAREVLPPPRPADDGK